MVVAISVAFVPVMAGEADGNFVIGGNPAPVVGTTELYDCGNPTGAMTPQMEYALSMTVTDESMRSSDVHVDVLWLEC
jgi:hypothetical protein